MREKSPDALIAAAIRTTEELQALVSMLENLNTDDSQTKLVSKLRDIANLFDKLPLLSNDLVVIKRRLRKMMTIDPEATPRPVSLKDLNAVSVMPEPEKKRYEAVDQEYRTRTQPGLGIPLPKKGS